MNLKAVSAPRREKDFRSDFRLVPFLFSERRSRRDDRQPDRGALLSLQVSHAPRLAGKGELPAEMRLLRG